MLPHDLPLVPLSLPPGKRGPAVYMSGNQPRHIRLGYLLQAHFPGLLAEWWMFMPDRPGHADKRAACTGEYRAQSPARAMALLRQGQLRELAARARHKLRAHELRRMSRKVRAYLARDDWDRVEQELIGPEVAELRSGAHLFPLPVSTSVSPARLAALRAIEPYFLVAYGAPALPAFHQAVLATVRGLALRQHDGWLPASAEHCGGNPAGHPIENALYHRRLDHVGSTVVTMAPSGTAGQVLRRSTCALHPDDTWRHCVMAAAALGNELVVDVIHDACKNKELVAFAWAQGAPSSGPELGVAAAGHGQGHGSRAADLFRRDAICRDMGRGWLADALDATTDF